MKELHDECWNLKVTLCTILWVLSDGRSNVLRDGGGALK